MKKVLCIISNYNNSEATKLSLNISLLLMEKKYDIKVLFLERKTQCAYLDLFLRENDIYYEILSDKVNVIDNILSGFNAKTKSPKLLSDKWKPNIIYSNTVLIADYEFYNNLKVGNVRIIMHLYLQTLRLAELNTDKKNFLRQVDFLLTVSSAQRDFLRTIGISNDKIAELTGILYKDGIVSQAACKDKLAFKYSLNTDVVLIGCVGYVSKRKGTDVFIDMVNLFNEKYKFIKVEFIWLGQGNHKDIGLSAEDIPHNFRFLGAIDNMDEAVNALDIFVLPSLDEGTSLSMLEAMFHKVTVLAFDIADNRCILNNCGIVVNSLDIEAMSFSLYELSIKPILRNKLGYNAYIKIKDEFDLRINFNRVFDFVFG